MLNQIIKLNRSILSSDGFLTLDDRTGEFIFKDKKDITENDKKLCTRILDRLAQEGVHPGIQNLIKFKLERYEYYNKCRGLVTEEDIRDLNSHINTMMKQLETRSYVYEIAQEAKKPAYYNTLMGMGIDPDYYFDPSSPYYLEIIKDLEEKNVDLISPDTNLVRYVLSYILKDHEDTILNVVNSDFKKGPIQLIKKLKELKASNQYNNYVLDKLIVQAEVWEVMQKNAKLKDFPFEEIWRFCIDIEFQEFGPYIFENEPGYIIATLNALRFGLELKKPTHLDYIEINRKCGENVLFEFECGNTCIVTELAHEGQMKMGGGYGIYGISTMDKEGLQDLEERSQMPDGPFHYAPSSLSAKIYLTKRPEWQHVCELKFLFDQHDAKIAAAKNIAERLIAHIWFSRELSLQHHMQDGNGRAAQITFLSLLANDPELPMILLDTNPNLDTNGPVAFVKRIVQAMAHYNKLCGIDEAPLTFEEVAKMLDFDDPKKCLWSYYHPTQEERQAFIDAHPQAEFEEELKHLNDNVELAPKRVWKTDYYKDRVVKSEPIIAERLYNFIDIIRSSLIKAVVIIFFVLLVWHIESNINENLYIF